MLHFCLKFFILIFSIILFNLPIQAHSSENSWMQDQTDQTDIFAIPLDSSEEEETMEQHELDQLQKKSERKAVPRQPASGLKN